MSIEQAGLIALAILSLVTACAVPLALAEIRFRSWLDNLSEWSDLQGARFEDRRELLDKATRTAVGRAVFWTSVMAPDVPLHRCVIRIRPEFPGSGPKIGGTVEIKRAWKPWGSWIYDVTVDTRDPARVVAHELAEHVLPHASGEGWNRYHNRADLTALSERIGRMVYGPDDPDFDP